MPNGKNKKALPSRHWDESGKRFVVPPKFGPMRPFLLLVRGARRGCFHPRSFAVLTDSLPRRAFSPRARLSAAAVWRLLLRGQHGYTLLYAICRRLSSRRVYFLYSYTEGLLCVYRSAAATYRRNSPAAFGGALFFVKTRRSTEDLLCVCRSAATMYWRKRAAAYTPSPSNAGVYASSAEVRSCTNPSVMPQFRI